MITQEYLKSELHYDEDSGEFTRKRGHHGVNKGDVAGSRQSTGYKLVYVGGNRYKEHRLVWLYITGRFPTHCIDHIDGNPSNNRFENLREATIEQNQHNRKLDITNTSGFKGVSFHKRYNKWQAKISIKNKTKFLGFFCTPEEASSAYEKAAILHRGKFHRKPEQP